MDYMKKILYIGCSILLCAVIGVWLYRTISGNSILKPTGPHGIGSTTYHYTHNDTAPRELIVQVWYPHNTNQAPCPVILFLPGLGVCITQYKTVIEELVSHGYIVVGVNYPVTAHEDIAQIQTEWVSDLQFVLDNLKNIASDDILAGKLDLNRIGLAGHSVGGGVSVNACAIDVRCKAVANIDGRFTYSPHFNKGFETPILFIRNPFHKQDKKEQLLQQLKQMTGPAEYHEIPNMRHNSFTDAGLADAYVGLQETRKLLVEFFRKYL